MKHSVSCLLVAVMTVVCFAKVHASNITLNWDPSSSPGAAGYDVYYGTTSGNYPYKIDAGNATSVTISNLVPGTTYYIAATTYDTNGDESPFSGELSYTVPVNTPGATLTMASGSSVGSPAALQFLAQAGHSYEIQATSDFVNWTSIWQSATATADGSMQFTDPDAGSYSMRFYRLVTH